jgi:para-nitrobenzyl esterase
MRLPPQHWNPARCSRRTFLTGSVSIGVGAMPIIRARAQSPDVLVEATHGKVRGTSVGGVRVFRGIPYAASTAGANRFLPPQPVAPWPGIRDAVEFGPRAPQLTTSGQVIIPGSGQSPIGEDCLRVNVFTPGTNAAGRRPVMVWLHGGGWRAGSGNIDGANLAAFGDVVVISLNHRFTLFGHLKLDDQDERFADSGNAGVLDMVAALRWVRDNVAAFGGDPGNVTIFGQSGGASKVCALMAAPAASGLFHKAISQSSSGNLRRSWGCRGPPAKRCRPCHSSDFLQPWLLRRPR